MGLESVKEILGHSVKHRYGVAAFNVYNYESVLWAVSAAESEGMPVIIQFYPGYTVHISLKAVAEIVKDIASRAAVPVGLHLDHARDYETALEGIKAGFGSVMIDGSLLPFDGNVRLTADVARAAKAFGVDVEAELGHVGSGGKVEDFTNPHNYTDPTEVKRFLELTGADSLAVSIGNGHGHYVQSPVRDFERINAIRAETDAPLVLHGGSEIPDAQIVEAVVRGMNKFNIATEYGCALYGAMKEAVGRSEQGKGSFFGVLNSMKADAEAYVRAKIKLLNPGGQVGLWSM